MRITEFTQPSSSNNFSPPGLHCSNVEMLNFCPLLRISLITLSKSQSSLSEGSAYYHHSYQLHLSVQYTPCTAMPMLYHWPTNLALAHWWYVDPPFFTNPSKFFYMSTNTGYRCNLFLAIILYCCSHDPLQLPYCLPP